jgi:hypothetical protein
MTTIGDTNASWFFETSISGDDLFFVVGPRSTPDTTANWLEFGGCWLPILSKPFGMCSTRMMANAAHSADAAGKAQVVALRAIAVNCMDRIKKFVTIFCTLSGQVEMNSLVAHHFFIQSSSNTTARPMLVQDGFGTRHVAAILERKFAPSQGHGVERVDVATEVVAIDLRRGRCHCWSCPWSRSR